MQNIGKVDLKGIELETQLAPVTGLQLTSSFGLNDSKIKKFSCQECQYIMGSLNGALGNQLSGAPRLTWTGSATYEHPINDDVRAYTRVDYRHKGSQFVDNANVAYSRQDDQVDLRFGVKTDALSFEVFATNLFDERTTYGFQSSDLIALSTTGALRSDIRLALPEKRRLGARASYSF